jgi:site-specific DNA recombinase
MSRAVIYLRVSSAGQLTGPDPDGFSIPAQRDACLRKAAAIGAEVADEYIDRAESAKTADRPQLQRMLARLATERDISYVIVHKVDRLARNRADDVTIAMHIRAGGARLVSATENIDETPSGMLLHGIMSSIAEFYSRNLGAEVVKGTTQKAMRGGTPGIAPLGYRNVRETVDGREVRTVALDPERAPLIRWAFELYATGRFSINELVALLEAKGLRTRGNRRYSPRPLNHSSLHLVLSNDYYVGMVSYRGKKYPGRHEALVSRTLFDQVQAVLAAHNKAGERERTHKHYLKGTLFCGECGLRLTYSQNTGNGGLYEYFVCPGKQRRQCSQRFHRADRIEDAIVAYYRKVQLSKARQERIRQAIRARLDEMAAVSERELTRCNQELRTLAEQEKKLLRAHYEDRISPQLYDEEQARIAREREAATDIIARLSVQFGDLEQTLELALKLTDDIQAAYARSTPTVRRLFNQALFEGIDISDEDVASATLATPFADLLADDLLDEPVTTEEQPSEAPPGWPDDGRRVPVGAGLWGRPADDEGPDPWRPGPFAVGSINRRMVGAAGFEPATSRV